ncbi:MAG: hypothetical protein WKG07_43215 [Hymenobacter sp.]
MLQPFFAEIKKFGGVATILWHNENFDPTNTRNGPQQFHEHNGLLAAAGRNVPHREIGGITAEMTADPIHNL